MKTIKSFSDFLTEAVASDHFKEQSFERVDQLAKVDFPQNIVNAIEAMGVKVSSVKDQVTDVIRETFNKEASRIEKREYNEGALAVPAGVFKIKVGVHEEYVTLTVKSPIYEKDKKGAYVLDSEGKRIKIGTATYSGERLYICVSDNYLTTVKVYSLTMRDTEIHADLKKHFLTKGNPKPVTIEPTSEEHIVKMAVLSTGEVIDPTIQRKDNSSTFLSKKEQSWTLKKGERIKLLIPINGEVEEVTIDSIINPIVQMKPGKTKPEIIWSGKFGETPAFSYKFTNKKTGQTASAIKELKPGTQIYLPTGKKDEFVKAEVVAKQLNRTQPNPVIIKYRT